MVHFLLVLSSVEL